MSETVAHKRYAVYFGRIGGDAGLIYLDTRADAQALGEQLQRVLLAGNTDLQPSKFCRLSKSCSRWRAETPRGEYVEVADSKHYVGWR